MSIKIYAIGVIMSLVVCGSVSAGPIDNARQFQEKAVKSSVKKESGKSLKPGIVVINTTGDSVVKPPADMKKTETKRQAVEVKP